MDDQRGYRPVDFHCHLDLLPDMHAAYERCEKLGCTTLTVTTTPKAFKRNQEYASKTQHVHAALGLHPQLVVKRGEEIQLFEELAHTTRFIGEIGLDAGRSHYSSFDLQKRVFARALDVCARQGDKVISVHSVRSAKHVLDAIEVTGVNSSCAVVLHWFSAGAAEIRRAISLGCWFSVNERMLSSSSGKELLSLAPPNHLLTETDAPFLEVGGRPIQPGDVNKAVTMIAAHHGTDEMAMGKIISDNAEKLLSPSI